MQLKDNRITFAIIFLLLLISCAGFVQKESQTKSETRNQTFADSLWNKYAKAMESNNIDYLIHNSLDTIQCCECKLENEKPNEFYIAVDVFRNHLDKLKHLPTLSDRDFTTFQNDDIIRVNYTVKSRYAEEGAYNLIFTFVKTAIGWKFQGMLIT